MVDFCPMQKPIEIFFMTDQPSSCPYCGTRTETLGDFYHTQEKRLVQRCLNEACAFIFFEDEDAEMLTLWGMN